MSIFLQGTALWELGDQCQSECQGARHQVTSTRTVHGRWPRDKQPARGQMRTITVTVLGQLKNIDTISEHLKTTGSGGKGKTREPHMNMSDSKANTSRRLSWGGRAVKEVWECLTPRKVAHASGPLLLFGFGERLTLVTVAHVPGPPLWTFPPTDLTGRLTLGMVAHDPRPRQNRLFPFWTVFLMVARS